MEKISMIDLHIYISQIQAEEQKERDSMKKTDLTNCLKSICDILCMMFYKK